MIVEWLQNTINTGIWVFIGLGIWTMLYFLYQSIRKKRHQYHLTSKSGQSSINRQIYNELIAIKTLANADRVYVMRFHNGTEFLPSQPVWKMSCTHEVVAPGITYESPRNQNLLVSLLSEVVSPLMLGNNETTGVLNIQLHEHHPQGQNIIRINVSELDENYCKMFLVNQHIHQSIMFAINHNENTIGFIGIDFCGKSHSDDKCIEIVKSVTQNVMKLKYLLFQK